MESILFIASECPACKELQPQALELFERWSIPLVVRKPSLRELKKLRIRGFPSLFLPFMQPPVLLAGSGAVAWLREHEEEVLDGYRLSHSNGNDCRSGAA